MDITGITTQSGIIYSSQTTVNEIQPDKTSATALKSGSVSQSISASTASSEELSNLNDPNYIKQQLSIIMHSFPPWFPAGKPQRLALIKGIKGVQYEIKNSSLSQDVKDKLTTNQLTNNSSDTEITAALQSIKEYKQQVVSTNSSSPVATGQTGTMVNLKV